MTNEQRQTEISVTLSEIAKISPEWSYLSVKIQTKTYINPEDEIKTHKEWNELDNKLYDLNKKLRSLQTEYYVDYFDDRNILRTAILMLNKKVDINTRKNGWDSYMNNSEVRQLLIDIHSLLLKQDNRPGISQVWVA
jgi:hypothetical protein